MLAWLGAAGVGGGALTLFGAYDPHPVGVRGDSLVVLGWLGWPPSGCLLVWAGLWVVARWVVTRIGGDKYPKPRREQN